MPRTGCTARYTPPGKEAPDRIETFTELLRSTEAYHDGLSGQDTAYRASLAIGRYENDPSTSLLNHWFPYCWPEGYEVPTPECSVAAECPAGEQCNAATGKCELRLSVEEDTL